MKIIYLNPEIVPLTVDTTLITVDTTAVTVDATTQEEGTTSKLTLLPRIIFSLEDSLTLYLRDELTEDEFNLPITSFNKNKGFYDFYFVADSLNRDSKYEIMLYANTTTLLYKGKALVTDRDRELGEIQDFTETKKTNGKLRL
jgi:hypothetical protein